MYAQHLETRWSEEVDNRPQIEKQLRSVYRRACTVHVYDKTTLYLLWSNFEEKTGSRWDIVFKKYVINNNVLKQVICTEPD